MSYIIAANVSLSKNYVSNTNIAIYISFIGVFMKKAGDAKDEIWMAHI
jgi:hypothetical protein